MTDELSAAAYAGLILAALLGGVVDAIAGGGGLVTVPALLAAGLPPALALGTNKGQAVFGSGAAMARFAAAGLVDRRVALATFPAGLLGSLAGAALVLLLPPAVLRPVILVLLVLVALFMTLRPAAPPPRAVQRSMTTAIALALVVGAYDGFFGPGTGTFLIFGFVMLFGAGMREASADAKVVNFASNLAAVGVFGSQGLVAWGIALPMAVGQFAGSLLGAHLAIRVGDRLVRFVVLLVVAALIAKLALDLSAGSS